MATEIDSLLSNLRAAFPESPHPCVEVCGQCYTDADEAALRGPREAVPDDLVVSVAAEVFDHWPEPADLYRWLTPRIIELLVTDRLAMSETRVASRLQEAGYSSWPLNQQHAVLSIAERWWGNFLSREPDIRNHGFVTNVLGFLVGISGTVEPWLSIWKSMPAGPADDHMRLLCTMWLPDLHAGVLEVGWPGGGDIASSLKPWLLENAPVRLARLGYEAAEHLQSLRELAQRGSTAKRRKTW